MYLLNYGECLIKLVWIYTHEEFKGRPPEKDLKQMLQLVWQESRTVVEDSVSGRE